QLHLEPADLLEQLGLLALGSGGGGLRPVLEDAGRPGKELLLPVVDEGGVDAELGGHLVDGLVALEGDLGLEGRRVLLPLRHRTTSRTSRYSLTGGPKSGVHYKPRYRPVWAEGRAGGGVAGRGLAVGRPRGKIPQAGDPAGSWWLLPFNRVGSPTTATAR